MPTTFLLCLHMKKIWFIRLNWQISNILRSKSIVWTWVTKKICLKDIAFMESLILWREKNAWDISKHGTKGIGWEESTYFWSMFKFLAKRDHLYLNIMLITFFLFYQFLLLLFQFQCRWFFQMLHWCPILLRKNGLFWSHFLQQYRIVQLLDLHVWIHRKVFF